MPDEFDFKKYKSIEEYSKTIEGTNYLHSLYLRAVNNPIRRKILTVINNEKRISKKDLLNHLLNEKIIEDISMFDYNIDYLIKAFCINSVKSEIDEEIVYEITQSGKVIDYLG